MSVGTFTVKSQETAHHQFNCVCSALSTILTGKRDYGGELENWLIRLRRSGADRHLYDSPGRVPASEDIEDTNKVTSTDFRLLARAMGIDINLYREVGNQSEFLWEHYSGNHKSDEAQAIYLHYTREDDRPHVKVILELKSIQ